MLGIVHGHDPQFGHPAITACPRAAAQVHSLASHEHCRSLLGHWASGHLEIDMAPYEG